MLYTRLLYALLALLVWGGGPALKLAGIAPFVCWSWLWVTLLLWLPWLKLGVSVALLRVLRPGPR